MAETFNAGDVVQLGADGPKMRVIAQGEESGTWLCEPFAGANVKNGVFREAQLWKPRGISMTVT
jgi:uncharacterized protein YodC (DUF2158 family)